ncbi:MAG TPA: ABC transporter permease [Firmicutes bacterium]|nr:ABC transporter permease [Candidatus Fermentithermobacillaceae bacterium]
MGLWIEILRSSILAAIPIALASLGGAFTYYTDVFNVALEGMMLVGAFLAVIGSYFTGSWAMGLLVGALGGLVIGIIFALFAVYMGADHFVTGMALNMFAVGGTTFTLRRLFGIKGALVSSRIVGIPSWNIPLLSKIPVLREVISGHPFAVYIALLLIALSHYLLFRTKWGLRLRAVGEDAQVLDSLGVSSRRIKTLSILGSGILCGFGGAFLSLGYVALFAEGMTSGRGWIALSVINVSRGRPWGLLLVSLVFGFFEGLGMSLQGMGLAPQFPQMIPYIITIVAVYVYSRRERRVKAA